LKIQTKFPVKTENNFKIKDSFFDRIPTIEPEKKEV
jgi:hypothetical protein